MILRFFRYQMFVGAININVRSAENSAHSFASLLLQLFKVSSGFDLVDISFTGLSPNWLHAIYLVIS